MNRIVAAAGAPAVTRHVPYRLAYAVGALSELVYRVLGRDDEPRMTRFVAEQLATAHGFDITSRTVITRHARIAERARA